MPLVKIYNDIPKINQYINFIFKEYKDDYIKCYLIDYNLDAIMTFRCLTSKKNKKFKITGSIK